MRPRPGSCLGDATPTSSSSKGSRTSSPRWASGIHGLSRRSSGTPTPSSCRSSTRPAISRLYHIAADRAKSIQEPYLSQIRRYPHERRLERKPRMELYFLPPVHEASHPAQPGDGALRAAAAQGQGARQLLRHRALLPLRQGRRDAPLRLLPTEGIVLGEEVNLRTLLGFLEMFAVEVAGAREVKYYPATSPLPSPRSNAHRAPGPGLVRARRLRDLDGPR